MPPSQKSKIDEMERQFFNPRSLDIYTEDEAKFHASTLRKRVSERADLLAQNDADYGNLEEAVDASYLSEVHGKAKTTVEVLSEHLELQHVLLDDLDSPDKRSTNKDNLPGSLKQVSTILLNQQYMDQGVNTVIKLLVRCRRLHQALFDMRKILQLVIKQYEMFHPQTGKYLQIQAGSALNAETENEVIKSIKTLQ